MLILFILAGYKIINNQKKNSTFLTYSVKILSTFAILLNTILTIPFFNIIIVSIYCKSGSPINKNVTCYSGIQFLHLTIGIISSIFMIFFSMLFITLFIDLNPSSNIPIASPQSKTNLLRLILKFFLPLYTTIDYSGSLTKEFIVVLTLYYLFILI